MKAAQVDHNNITSPSEFLTTKIRSEDKFSIESGQVISNYNYLLSIDNIDAGSKSKFMTTMPLMVDRKKIANLCDKITHYLWCDVMWPWWPSMCGCDKHNTARSQLLPSSQRDLDHARDHKPINCTRMENTRLCGRSNLSRSPYLLKMNAYLVWRIGPPNMGIHYNRIFQIYLSPSARFVIN